MAARITVFRTTWIISVLVLLALLLAPLAAHAARIEGGVGYYGEIVSGNKFQAGSPITGTYGAGTTVVLTDSLSSSLFGPTGSGCAGGGNDFCFDVQIVGANGTVIATSQDARSNWQVKSSNVTDGLAIEDPDNPGYGWFVVLPGRSVTWRSSTVGNYVIQGSSDPFDAGDANSYVLFIDPSPVVSDPGGTAGPASYATTINENTRQVGTFTADETVTWSLSGTDAGAFTITGGALVFAQAPDFENPGDSDRNNVYSLNVVATDSVNQATTLPVTVTVANVAEGAITGSFGTMTARAPRG